MMGRQARASVRVMRLWKPRDPGRSCLSFTIRHHVTNGTISHNAGALPRLVIYWQIAGKRRFGALLAFLKPRAGPSLSCGFGVEPPAGIEPATPSLP